MPFESYSSFQRFVLSTLRLLRFILSPLHVMHSLSFFLFQRFFSVVFAFIFCIAAPDSSMFIRCLKIILLHLISTYIRESTSRASLLFILFGICGQHVALCSIFSIHNINHAYHCIRSQILSQIVVKSF
jgi:hypothetical protein